MAPCGSSLHSLIKVLLSGPVKLIVLAAQVEESGRLDEVIDRQAAAFLAVAVRQCLPRQGVGHAEVVRDRPVCFQCVVTLMAFYFLNHSNRYKYPTGVLRLILCGSNQYCEPCVLQETRMQTFVSPGNGLPVLQRHKVAFLMLFVCAGESARRRVNK